MKSLLNVSRAVRTLLQTAFLYGSFLALLIFFIVSERRFSATESAPPIHYLMPRKAKDWHGKFSVVKVGMVVVNMPEFDVRKSEFILNALVWFRFNPLHVSQEVVGSFGFEEGEVLYRSDPHVVIVGDQLFVEYQIKVKFTSALAYHYFPFDDHSIYLVLSNRNVSSQEIVYVSDPSALRVSSTFGVDGWRLIDTKVAFGALTAEISAQDGVPVSVPVVRFRFDFAKLGLVWLITLIFPLMIFFSVSIVFLLFARTGNETAIVLLLTTIAAMLSYRFVIQTVQPSVGYLTVVDFLYLYDLIVALLVFLVCAWARDTEPDNKLLHMFKAYLPPLLCAIFVILAWYLLFGRF